MQMGRRHRTGTGRDARPRGLYGSGCGGVCMDGRVLGTSRRRRGDSLGDAAAAESRRRLSWQRLASWPGSGLKPNK